MPNLDDGREEMKMDFVWDGNLLLTGHTGHLEQGEMEKVVDSSKSDDFLETVGRYPSRTKYLGNCVNWETSESKPRNGFL